VKITTATSEWVDLHTAHTITGGRSIDALRRDARAGRVASRRAGTASNARLELSVADLGRLGHLVAEASPGAIRPGAPAEAVPACEMVAMRARLDLLERERDDQARTITVLLRLLEASFGVLGQTSRCVPQGDLR
jgi:hypothetical protein